MSCCCGILTGCCTNRVKRTLFATLHNAGGCACLDGITIQLDWDGTSRWFGSTTDTCGGQGSPVACYLQCAGGTWTSNVWCFTTTSPPLLGFVTVNVTCPDPSTSTPFSGSTASNITPSISGGAGGPCCPFPGGTVSVTFTE